MTQEKKDEILDKVLKDNFGSKCLKPIMVAYKDMRLDNFNRLKHYNNDFQSV